MCFHETRRRVSWIMWKRIHDSVVLVGADVWCAMSSPVRRVVTTALLIITELAHFLRKWGLAQPLPFVVCLLPVLLNCVTLSAVHYLSISGELFGSTASLPASSFDQLFDRSYRYWQQYKSAVYEISCFQLVYFQYILGYYTFHSIWIIILNIFVFKRTLQGYLLTYFF